MMTEYYTLPRWHGGHWHCYNAR
jgi:hypothetical protein